MATGFTTAEKGAILDARSASWGFASLHSADPAGTGANELTGGSPAYARKAVTWAGSSGGQVISATTAQVFDVPAGSTVAFVGLWSLVTAGTFRGCAPAGAALNTPIVFTCNSTTDIFTAPGSSFTNGQQVMLIDTDGSSLPTGVSEATTYFIVGASGATFQLALTSGGSAINLSADGAGHVVLTQAEVFGAQGTYTIAIGNLAVNLLAVS